MIGSPIFKPAQIWQKYHPIFLIIGIGFVVYGNTFRGEFIFDDFRAIVQNPYIKEFRSIFDIPFKTRLLPIYTFALNYHLHKFDVFGYHLVNLIVHLASLLLVFWVVHLIYASPRLKHSSLAQDKKIIALFSALIFLTHPLQTQAVAYIWQRCAALAAMFCLLAVGCYLKGRLVLNEGGQARPYFSAAAAAAGFGQWDILCRQRE